VPLLRAEGLRKTFATASGAKLHAVNDVSLAIEPGETLGLIGESGSGKSTVGRLLLRLIEAEDGTIEFEGQDVRALPAAGLRRLRARAQIVFQEPFESLNPRMRVTDIVGEPLEIHESSLSRAQRRAKVLAALERVGLDERFARRFPVELSGGQQQRVGIARAIVTQPRLIVLDEPTSSLDLSIRAQILELLRDLQARLGIAYLFISHDLATVEYVSHRIAVMYLGQIRETGPSRALVDDPRDPYTRALLSSVLSADPRTALPRQRLEGEVPKPTALPQRCLLYERCPIRIDACRAGPIALREVGAGHLARCLKADRHEAVAHTEQSRATGET
jgi:oligopeptide/dipeptide ABC transporter ATP-binding protein